MTPEKFLTKVEKTATCWLWRGYIRPNGYGQCGSGRHALRGAGLGAQLHNSEQCLYGHELTADNVYVINTSRKGTVRRCKACILRRGIKYSHAHLAERAAKERARRQQRRSYPQ